MQYDLELLEDLITVTLNPKRILLVQPTSAEIAGYELLAQTEKIRIRKRMKSITGKPVKEKYKQKYIQRNRQDIIVLKNTLVDYLMPMEAKGLEIHASDGPITRLYKLLFQSLKELLNDIEEYFRPYFNQDEKVPESIYYVAWLCYKSGKKILKENLQKAVMINNLLRWQFLPSTS
jgi:hypothetical protein